MLTDFAKYDKNHVALINMDLNSNLGASLQNCFTLNYDTETPQCYLLGWTA